MLDAESKGNFYFEGEILSSLPVVISPCNFIFLYICGCRFSSVFLTSVINFSFDLRSFFDVMVCVENCCEAGFPPPEPPVTVLYVWSAL